MKKIYTKPELFVENFLLSERVANCISEDPAFTNGCKIQVDPEVLAGFANIGRPNVFSTSCTDQVSGQQDLNADGIIDVCYHTTSGTELGYDNVFNS